jgi:hypothetical protein
MTFFATYGNARSAPLRFCTLLAVLMVQSITAFADITLETGNEDADPVNNAVHQQVCASSGAVLDRRDDAEDGFSLGISSSVSSSSTTTSVDQIGNGDYRVCFSFGAVGAGGHAGWRWLGWASWVLALIEGEIYIADPVAGAAIVKRHTTTPDQDLRWVLYMINSRVGKLDGYSVLRHNCRKFSQLEFDAAPQHW